MTPAEMDAAEQRTETLVRLARAGDRTAWASLYARLYAVILRTTRAGVGDHALADDLAQDTFAEAFANLEAYGGRSSFRSWLNGIAWNLMRNHWRANARYARVCRRFADDNDPGFRRSCFEAAHARTEAATALRGALEQLPDPLRTAFTLRYVDGLSLAGAAAKLGVSVSNVGVRAHRARARMRTELARAGWGRAA